MISVLEDRAVIRVGGAAAQGFLQGLVSQDMATADRGLAFAALLSPQGKIAAEFIVAKSGDGYLLDCAASIAEALLKKLTLYRLRAPVELARTDHIVAVAAVAEPSLLQRGFASDPRLSAMGVRAIVPRAALVGLPMELAGTCEARRIDLGVPELGKDFAPDEMFLLDVNYDALNGVSYRKGCFVGQEVTSRMKRKGEIRRRTLIARFEGAAPPKGARITAGDSEIGEIMSGAGGVALAAVRLDRCEQARARGDDIVANGKPLRLAVPDYLEGA